MHNLGKNKEKTRRRNRRGDKQGDVEQLLGDGILAEDEAQDSVVAPITAA